MKYTIMAAMAFLWLNGAAQDSVKVRKMPIQKVSVWKNGKTYNAEDIDVTCVWDDLKTTARFYYRLEDSTGVLVADGNVEITGSEYFGYASKPNHDRNAVNIVMKELNLVNRPNRAAAPASKK